MRDEAARAEEERALVLCMREYQAGSLAGFERLHAVLRADLLAFVRRLAGDPAAAPDLVQETFLELHRARRTYLPPLPVRPWVFGIARNVVRRHRREWARRRRAIADVAPEAVLAASPAVPVEALDVPGAVRALPPGR